MPKLALKVKILNHIKKLYKIHKIHGYKFNFLSYAGSNPGVKMVKFSLHKSICFWAFLGPRGSQ